MTSGKVDDRNEPPRGRMTYDDAVNVIVWDWLMGQGCVLLLDDDGSITPTQRTGMSPSR